MAPFGKNSDMTILIEKKCFLAVAKEQIRQIISENNISSVADVYSLLKESFKDILQELMEAELDAFLGYEKIRREIWPPPINETAIPLRPSKASMGNSRLMCPGTAMGSLTQSSFRNTSGMSTVCKSRSSPCTPGE